MGARVVHRHPGDRWVLLADATAQTRLRWPRALGPLPALGAWWVLLVRRLASSGEPALSALQGLQVGLPRRPFPAPGGEWLRFHEEETRRARLLRRRAELTAAVRAFFDARGFLEVETPVGVHSPGVEPHLHAFALHEPGPWAPRWLRTSPEYEMKRLLAGGFPRIVQIGPVFRREELGPWHEPEFTLLEWYRAFATMEAVIEDTERLVAELAERLHGRPILPTPRGPVEVCPPWPRVSVDEAFRRHAGCSVWDVLPDEERFFLLFAERVQPALGDQRALFLVDWPASMASLARLSPRDPRVAERFEAFAGGIELCNGFGELTDPEEQRARFQREAAERKRLGLPEHPICERFLDALEEGLPPSAGNALGLDRLFALLLDVDNVQDVRAIPVARLDRHPGEEEHGPRRAQSVPGRRSE